MYIRNSKNKAKPTTLSCRLVCRCPLKQGIRRENRIGYHGTPPPIWDLPPYPPLSPTSPTGNNTTSFHETGSGSQCVQPEKQWVLLEIYLTTSKQQTTASLSGIWSKPSAKEKWEEPKWLQLKLTKRRWGQWRKVWASRLAAAIALGEPGAAASLAAAWRVSDAALDRIWVD